MIKTTRWSPDTCKCLIDINWDTDDTSIHTHTLVSACPSHKSASIDDVVLENQTKNKAIQTVSNTSADFSKLDNKGNIVPDLEKIEFSYDKNRILNISLKVSSQDVSAIKSALDSKLGAGKVILG